MSKLLYGVGVSADGLYKRTEIANSKRKGTKEYDLWVRMLDRCYNKSSRLKHPSYEQCIVSENFKNFQYFAKWCNSQIGFKQKGFELDKDILSKGNKLYSEDTCVFVPKELNVLLINSRRTRGDFPLGVYFHKQHQKFLAKITINGVRKHIGLYRTSIDAFNAYKSSKEAYIKVKANEYVSHIDPKAFTALMNYQVEITD